MKRIVFVLLLLVLTVSSWGYYFRFPLDFVDSPTSTAQCTIGVEPGATDGIDFGVDMIAIPPFMWFDAQIVNDSGAVDLRTDIRSDSDSVHIWKVQFYNFTAPGITMHWFPTWVPSDTLRELYVGQGLMADSVDWIEASTVDTLMISAGYFAFIKLTQDVDPTPVDTMSPVISDWIPSDGDSAVSGSTVVAFTATDDVGIDTSFGALHFWVNDMDIAFIANKFPVTGGIRVEYTPFLPFAAGSTVTAIAQVQDRATPPNVTTDTISFYIGGGSIDDTLHSINVQVMFTGMPPFSGSKVEIIELMLSDTTDMIGNVSFDSIPENNYTVVASRDGYFSAGTTLALTSDTLLMFFLEEDTTGGGGGVTIDGTVELSGGGDYSGSILQLTSVLDSSVQYDTTNSTGFYSITGVMPGLYNLKASHVGYESDSAIVFAFFSDTTVNFMLDWSGASEIMVIDWDNGDVLMPWGFGPAEWTYDVFSTSPWASSIMITPQDPDITSLDLTGCKGIILVTGTRLGTNTMIDDSSLAALTDFVDGGGNIYWEGPDAAGYYSTGSVAAQSFFDLFGASYGAEGFSASTGNVFSVVLDNIVIEDTLDYAFMSEADHYVDELVSSGAMEIAHSVGGPTPAVSTLRATYYAEGISDRYLSSFYLAAVESCQTRNDYRDEVVYMLMDMTGIDDTRKPESPELLSIKPNPFNASCRITAPGPVEIYDISGRLVKRLGGSSSKVNEFWKGRDSDGREMPSGVYLAVVKNVNGSIRVWRRISLVR